SDPARGRQHEPRPPRRPSRGRARRGVGRETQIMPLRALARVNLAAIERNVARLEREVHGTSALCAVVKADGYGHGAVPSAQAAIAGGASWLAVAAAAEAAQLRAGGIETPILVGALSREELRV